MNLTPFFNLRGDYRSLLLNANGMLLMATNVVRMAHGLPSPMLPILQQQYADCLPNTPTIRDGGSYQFPPSP